MIGFIIWSNIKPLTHLQGQPAEGEGQHGGYQQGEGLLPPLAPALLAVGWLPWQGVASQVHSDSTVGYADGQQWDHIGSYEDEAGVEQPQMAAVWPELLTHY